MEILIATFALTVVFVAIPVLLYVSMRLAKQRNGGFRKSVGHALEELDKHTTRPSVEIKIEHEAQVVYENNEHGGK